jgi:hypothetical protein
MLFCKTFYMIMLLFDVIMIALEELITALMGRKSKWNGIRSDEGRKYSGSAIPFFLFLLQLIVTHPFFFFLRR